MGDAEGPLARFGALILSARVARGWSIRDLSAHSGVGLNTCSTAERGRNDPRFTSALKLAAALGIDLSALVQPNGTGASPFAGAAIPEPGSTPGAPAARGRLARVEVKGFRDLGIVRVTETTLAGEPMLHAECDDGSSADFPPSSLHFITWLPEGAQAPARAAIPADPWGEPDEFGDGEPGGPF